MKKSNIEYLLDHMKTTPYVMYIVFILLSCQSKPDKSPSSVTETVGPTPALEQIEAPIELFPSHELPNEDYKIHLLRIGELHEEDIPKHFDTSNFKALFKSQNDSFYVSDAQLKIERIFDPVIDQPTETTGYRIQSRNADEVILLFSKSTSIEDGEKQGIDGLYPLILENDTLEFSFGKYEYTIASRVNSSPPYNYHLSARINPPSVHASSILSMAPFLDDSKIEILWIGDLDNDQVLDFVVDNSYKYNSFTPTLYLSTLGFDHELVGIAGMNKFFGS